TRPPWPRSCDGWPTIRRAHGQWGNGRGHAWWKSSPGRGWWIAASRPTVLPWAPPERKHPDAVPPHGMVAVMARGQFVEHGPFVGGAGDRLAGACLRERSGVGRV